jgi:hypothetical protein
MIYIQKSIKTKDLKFFRIIDFREIGEGESGQACKKILDNDRRRLYYSPTITLMEENNDNDFAPLGALPGCLYPSESAEPCVHGFAGSLQSAGL